MIHERPYTVTVFSPRGTKVHVDPGLTETQARTCADSLRPPDGATYIRVEGAKLKFKPYRQNVFRTEQALYFSPTYALRRPSNAQIEQAARRDPDNAAALLELRR